MMRVGEKIEAERLRKGWKQQTLAAAVGANQPNVSSWEQGKTLPEPQFIPKLSDVLGIDAQWLSEQVVKEKREKTKEKKEQAKLTAQESELLGIFNRLSPERQTALLVQLRNINRDDPKAALDPTRLKS